MNAGDESPSGQDESDEGATDAADLQRQAAGGDELARWAVNMTDAMDEAGYRTPEEAVLAEWDDYPGAAARVISVTYSGENEAVVVTDTVPSHPMWNYCMHTAQGWVFTHDHN